MTTQKMNNSCLWFNLLNISLKSDEKFHHLFVKMKGIKWKKSGKIDQKI